MGCVSLRDIPSTREIPLPSAVEVVAGGGVADGAVGAGVEGAPREDEDVRVGHAEGRVCGADVGPVEAACAELGADGVGEDDGPPCGARLARCSRTCGSGRRRSCARCARSRRSWRELLCATRHAWLRVWSQGIHSLVNATTLQELNVEVRGIRHLSVHNLKKKRETNRMKWVRVSLSVCYFSLANFFVRD